MSGYLHHIGPELGGYPVHNIYSFGKVLYLTQCVPATPVMETDGHGIEYLALSMVTALPPFITCTGSRVLAPEAGIEPTTNWLTANCTTAVLLWNNFID